MIALDLIRKHAASRPKHHAFCARQSQLTWEEFLRDAERKIEFLLTRYGCDMPMQACYVTPNRIDLMPWLAALASLGIPCVGIDYTLELSSLQKLVTASNAELILTSSKLFGNENEFVALCSSAAAHFDLDSGADSYHGQAQHCDSATLGDRIRACGSQSRPFRSVGFTSGTTSLPKVVLRNASFDKRRFAYFIERYGFNMEDRFMLSMPLYHAAGNGWARLFLSLGATVYVPEPHSTHDLVHALESEGITATVMTPNILAAILNQCDGSNGNRSTSLRWLLVGGKYMPVSDVRRALEKLGPCIYEYYGTTETGVNTIAEPADLASHPNSVGKAYDGNALAIVDERGQALPPMSVGRVAVDSYMNMASYADGSAQSLDIGGSRYLLTPEQGFLDDDGRLYLYNRSETPGNHANLYRLEDSIRGIPGVEDVAIVARHLDGRDQMTCAFTIRKYDESDLLQRVAVLAQSENVTFSECKVIPTIPYSPSGKVRVQQLHSLLSTS